MAEENNIELRNIKSLSGLHFYIPAYQRGYRWTATQAKQMLEDFKEFADKKDSSKLSPKEFYCLQPIVVKHRTWQNEKNEEVEGYEVIDGQQRLTTLYLLFKALGKSLMRSFTLFTITYSTRADSEKFLENIDNNDVESTSYVDYFYMDMVYNSIKSWLQEHDDEYNYPFANILLKEQMQTDADGNEYDEANNVRIIWYELGNSEKSTSIDVFTRLNIGKIPLTNAELVKALLLRKSNFEPNATSQQLKLLNKEIELKQLYISEEWNVVEHRLQDDAFWYFIYNTSNPVKYDTRIEYLLDLIMDKYSVDKGEDGTEKPNEEDKGDYYTFDKFNELMDSHSHDPNRAENVWNVIKRFYQTIEYWYNDRKLFHLIGFLIEYGTSISALVKSSQKMPKKDFLKYVESKVSESIKGINLDALDYNNRTDKYNIQKVLLLFNILTVLSSDRSDVKFPFDKYKDESWDREHIASRTDQPFPSDNKKRKAWINDMIFYFVGDDAEDGESLRKLSESKDVDEKLLAIFKGLYELKSWLDKGVKKTEGTEFTSKFNALYNIVMTYFDENKLPERMKDGLGNMALLNYSINRSYGNAFFPIKRAYIKDNDSKGVFVPIATKNVFMKYYSRKIDNMMVWTAEDAADYLTEIKKTLKKYLS